MADAPLKKQKQCEFGEEDVCNLFQRYTAPQVLAFLREVAQSPGVKIDWNDLVKRTASGLTTARECQILWRHLAYRQPFPEKMEEQGDQPLDDDSDLEYELEASPPVSTELAMEAANCVKRWGIIRKKQGSLNLGGTSSQLSEAQLAARRAINMALKDNITGGSSTVGNGAAATGDHASLNASNGDVPADSNAFPSQPPNTHPTNTSTKPAPMSASMAKPCPPLKKVPAKQNVSDRIQVAAVAAGARIASPSDAATLFKAAQSNTVHIMGGGSSLIKSSTTGDNPLPPNVHFIRTALAAKTPTSIATGAEHQTKGSALKPTAPTAPVSQLSKTKRAPSSSANEPQQMEDKTSSTEVKVLVLDVKPGLEVQEDKALSLPKCFLKAHGKGPDSNPGKQTVDADSLQYAMSEDMPKSERKDENPADNDKWSMAQGNCNPGMTGSHGVSPSSVVNADYAGKMEASTSSEADKSEPKDQ